MDELRVKLEKYLANAEAAFAEITVEQEAGERVKDTALRYFKDAKHFFGSGELVNAFAALEYAEGWLDAGLSLGVVKSPGKQSQLP